MTCRTARKPDRPIEPYYGDCPGDPPFARLPPRDLRPPPRPGLVERFRDAFLTGLLVFSLGVAIIMAVVLFGGVARGAAPGECPLQTMRGDQIGSALRAARNNLTAAIHEVERPPDTPEAIAKSAEPRKVLAGRLKRNLQLVDRMLKCKEFQ